MTQIRPSTLTVAAARAHPDEAVLTLFGAPTAVGRIAHELGRQVIVTPIPSAGSDDHAERLLAIACLAVALGAEPLLADPVTSPPMLLISWRDFQAVSCEHRVTRQGSKYSFTADGIQVVAHNIAGAQDAVQRLD